MSDARLDSPADPLYLLRRAGALVGLSNERWWRDLIEAHGEETVLAIVEVHYVDTRQPVNAAVVKRDCDALAQSRQDVIDDAAADAAMVRQVARGGAPPSVERSDQPQHLPTRMLARMGRLGMSDRRAAEVIGITGPALRKFMNDESGPGAIAKVIAWLATPEIQLIDAAPVAAIGDSERSRPGVVSIASPVATGDAALPTNQEIHMANIPQLIAQVDAEIARRGIPVRDAMGEIGASTTAIYSWRKAGCSAVNQAKIARWLLGSAKGPDGPFAGPFVPKAETDARRPDVETVACAGTYNECNAVVPLREKTAVTTTETMDTGDLLTQGELLCEALRALGANGFADVAAQFVCRLRTVRNALSA